MQQIIVGFQVFSLFIQALRQSKEFNQSTLMSLPNHIAVLDREGHILTVTDAWLEFAREKDMTLITANLKPFQIVPQLAVENSLI